MMKYRFFIFWVLFSFISFKLSGFSSEQEVKSLLDQGKLEAENGEFANAMNSLNQAMGYLRQVSSSHPLLEEVQKQMRIS